LFLFNSLFLFESLFSFTLFYFPAKLANFSSIFSGLVYSIILAHFSFKYTMNSLFFLGEILLVCICGMLTGFVSGITPGLHLNLVSVLAVSLLPSWNLPMLFVFVGVMSMAVTHTIVDILASTYIGVPDENAIAGLLPAQELVLNGNAHRAVTFTIIGSVLCVFCTLPFIFLLYSFLSIMQNLLTPILGWLLLSVILFLLWHEKEQRLECFCIFLFAGALGTVVLSYDVLNQPLLPLLGGLFGGAGLVELIRLKIKIPAQSKQNVSGKIDWVCVVSAAATGVCAAFLPGIGSSQAGILAARALGNRGTEAQLIVAGGINTVNMVFSIVTWIALGKSRDGAIAALSSIGNPTFLCAALLLVICCVVAPLAGLIALFLSRRICSLFERINYQYLSCIILLFVLGLIFSFDVWRGLLVFFCALTLGLVCQQMGTPRHYLMGCLLLQVLVFFLQ